MADYKMIIDLEKCVGCSACQIACKIENTVGEDVFYSNHTVVESGEFPNMTYKYIPTMCNQCANAPCVAVCPTEAMHKQDGLTLHDDATCIGCGACVRACPYNNVSMRNPANYSQWQSDSEIIEGCTASGKEVSEKTGVLVPYGNLNSTANAVLLANNLSQKCCSCYHLVQKGEAPYCVTMCPADARLFGDASDPESDVAKAFKDEALSVSHPEYGTSPQVFYIGDYQA